MPQEREAELLETLQRLAALCSTGRDFVTDMVECIVLDVHVPWENLAEFADVLKATALLKNPPGRT